jgi:hypothetical protein
VPGIGRVYRPGAARHDLGRVRAVAPVVSGLPLEIDVSAVSARSKTARVDSAVLARQVRRRGRSTATGHGLTGVGGGHEVPGRPFCPPCSWPEIVGARYENAGVVTVADVRALALTLPRTTEHLIRDRVKFRVKQIVYCAFSRDETRTPRRSAMR